METVHLVKEDIKDERRVIVVLEKAPLQIAYVKRENVLLNSDDHSHYISTKLNKDPAEYRPDITHQCLLTLLDSPLNKAQKLQIYITTATNQVIRINPATRIPRNFKRFSALFAQLLKRLSIRAEESRQILLHVIKSPVTKYLPPDCLKVALSTKGKLVKIADFGREIQKGKPIVFLVGAVAKGNPTMEVSYFDQSICISQYALSASVCLSKITTTFQELYNIH